MFVHQTHTWVESALCSQTMCLALQLVAATAWTYWKLQPTIHFIVYFHQLINWHSETEQVFESKYHYSPVPSTRYLEVFLIGWKLDQLFFDGFKSFVLVFLCAKTKSYIVNNVITASLIYMYVCSSLELWPWYRIFNPCVMQKSFSLVFW